MLLVKVRARAGRTVLSCRGITMLAVYDCLQPDTCSYARRTDSMTWTRTSTRFPISHFPPFLLSLSPQHKKWQSSRFGCCFHELRPLAGRGESTAALLPLVQIAVHNPTYTLFIFSFFPLLRCI